MGQVLSCIGKTPSSKQSAHQRKTENNSAEEFVCSSISNDTEFKDDVNGALKRRTSPKHRLGNDRPATEFEYRSASNDIRCTEDVTINRRPCPNQRQTRNSLVSRDTEFNDDINGALKRRTSPHQIQTKNSSVSKDTEFNDDVNGSLKRRTSRRRQLETITGNSKNQNIAKLQERRAKSKSLPMYDRNHNGHSSELQQGSAYLRHIDDDNGIYDGWNRSKKSQSLVMDDFQSSVDFLEMQQTSTCSTSKTPGSQQILKETSTNDNINTVIHREQDLDTYSVSTWSSGFSRKNQETSDYGTMEKRLKENNAHTFSYPSKEKLISKDSQPVACCGIQERSGRSLETAVRNDIIPSNMNQSWNCMPYINNEANIPYRMDNLTRGYCIIFNVAVVEGRFRDGSHVDVRKLKQTFQFLGFVVSVIDNPSKLEINRTLRNYTAADHSQDDCFACVILSHGYEGHIKSSKNEDISLEEMMETIKNCRSLAGKPKLFFVQACRGDKTKHKYVTDAISDMYSASIAKLSSHFDVLVSYATIKDYVAYRDVQDGSVYISILCELLHKEGLDSTLTDLLHKVNYYASTIVGVTDTESDITQVPIFTSTLRRPLQFTKRKQPVFVKTIVKYDDGSTEDFIVSNYLSPSSDGTDLV